MTFLTLLVFSLDWFRYALRLPAVQSVIRIVEITPVPECPSIVLGIINLRGLIVPVVDIRRRFHLPGRPLNLSDQLIIARTSRRTVALWVDSVAGITERPGSAIMAADGIAPGLEYLEGVAKLDDGLVLIHNLDTFLSLDEEAGLERSLETAKEGSP